MQTRSSIVLSDTIENSCQASKDLDDDANTDMRVSTMMKYQLIIILQLQYLYIYYIYLRVHCQDTIRIVECSETIKMLTAKSLVTYKIGYNPDGKKKHKSVEVAFNNGATQTFEIHIVSGEKEIEFQVNEQLPLYDGLAEALVYIGPEKFSHYGTYLSGAFKSTWENELNANYPQWKGMSKAYEVGMNDH
jgi:hypothetical protein